MPNLSLGWTIREKLVGYEVLIWAESSVLYRGHARTRAQATRLAEHWRKKLLPEAFRREEKEVDGPVHPHRHARADRASPGNGRAS